MARRPPQPLSASAKYFPPRSAIALRSVLPDSPSPAGLYIVPVFAAVQSWAGADRRARVIAAVNVLNAACMVGGTLLVAVLQSMFSVSASMLFVLMGMRDACGRRRYRPHDAGERIQRFSLHRVSRLLSRRDRRRGESSQGRHKPDHRAQPRELSRRAVGALAARPRSGFRHRRRNCQTLVGAAVPGADPRHAARSDHADGDPHVDQCGARRRAADHLSGRAHHGHRQPDEGLRRRRSDRRQVERLRGAGAHRGAGDDAVQPPLAAVR